MNHLQKIRIPILIVFCVGLGFASAAVFARYNYFVTPGVNIFEKTKTESPGIRWLDTVDASNIVSPISIEGELIFLGERVPLEDPEVRERLERELQLNAYWQSNTMMAMKMSNRYFDLLDTLLVQNGVPADFKYLALIESGFRNDVSPAGAVGFWQMVKATAQIYGLEINDEVDERYNIEKSTAAAAKYLSNAKGDLGNWTIAAASYNLGITGMMNRIKDQKTNNFYEMYFNPETSRYIFRMLAMKIIFSNPKRAGLYVKPEDLYQPYQYKTVAVEGSIDNIADFAAQYNLKYKHIKMLNTWLREARLTNREHKKYQIKILELRD